MNKVNPQPPRLESRHLDEIRASIDWPTMFAALGLRKCEKKSKQNDWWAYSPFHDEMTPSFHMGPGGLWYDFSIGEGGGPIELIQRMEGGNCYEAGRIILERRWATASIDLAQPVTQTRQRTQARAAHAVAPDCAGGAPRNAPIRQDLLKMCAYHDTIAARGISEETCDLLGIGFLPQGRSPLKDRIVFQVADARAVSQDDRRTRVILSHLGRSIEDAEPKYLFYQGFHKSDELYAQELIWLHEDAADQIQETGTIILTEGPFDVAKAVEAGLRNVVGSFGASLSDAQADKLKTMADARGAKRVRIAFDRDDAGRTGAKKAAQTLRKAGLEAEIFDWDAPVGRNRQGDVYLPTSVQDLADFSTEQLQWLRQRRLL
ncbi:toprim domain-containing protein [Thalassococcus lentus]|uniref:Toprim domain-containing protein n=1 Tax=Thalassococcus lentus TaxID=1210524 RepID=A0ABT4XXU1_9RHOB|nr:toprim domain-containing protein [Thalassococcus lentus]MDA7426766.1 toprim domain-containing protein [Thalassococcus lentus]